MWPVVLFWLVAGVFTAIGPWLVVFKISGSSGWWSVILGGSSWWCLVSAIVVGGFVLCPVNLR